MRWGGWVVGLVLAGAVGLSVFKSNASTIGQQYIAAVETAHPQLRPAALVIDYTPDPASVARADKEIGERGEGDPRDGAVGAVPDAHRHWVRTADATFSWREGAGPSTVRTELPPAAEVLAAAVERGPLDDAREKTCTGEALRALAGLSDEALLLAWINADRGVLAEAHDRTAAVRETLLLLVPGGEGPVLTWHDGTQTVYVLPEPPTNEAQWCTLQAFDVGGKFVWQGHLRIKREANTERVRTLIAMFSRLVVHPA